MKKSAKSLWLKGTGVAAGFLAARWLVRRRRQASCAQHIRIHIPVSAEMGTPEERERISMLEDQLEGAVQPFGMHDGNEYGDGACELYFYGPDADRLYDAIAPLLEDVPDGSFVLKRRGGPDVAATRIAIPPR